MMRLLFCALVAVATCAPIYQPPSDLLRFDNHQVLRVVPQTDAQLDALRTMFDNAHNLNLDFWVEPSYIGRFVDVRCGPEGLEDLKNTFNTTGLTHEVLIEDMQPLVAATYAPTGSGWFDKYQTADDIATWTEDLAKTFSNISKLVQVGSTYEGKKINAIKIATGGDDNGKPTIWLDGGIHAREWISPATVQYILHGLLTGYGSDTAITNAINSVNWIIVPLFNIDGYEYTFAKDRMWRKTRSKNHLSLCVGTDPNRNWDFHWGEGGASHDPCSEAYRGPKAASEIEISSVQDYIKADTSIHAYVNFHSYSQLWMYPWGYTTDETTDKDAGAQKTLGDNCVSALGKVHGTKFENGPIAEIIYVASGSSADWTYGVASAKFSYGVELRDTGKYGFLLPPDQIVPSGEETLAAVLSMAKTVQADYVASNSDDCHASKDAKSCDAMASCSWCNAKAVPSACYTTAEAKQLPPAVFVCDKK